MRFFASQNNAIVALIASALISACGGSGISGLPAPFAKMFQDPIVAAQEAHYADDDTEALYILDQVISKQPTIDSLRLRSEIYLGGKAYDSAVADLTLAIQMGPYDVWLLQSRSYAYSISGRFDSAIADMTTMIAAQRSEPAHWIQRSVAYQNAGYLDSAIRALNEAIQRSPSAYSASMHVQKAMLRYQQTQYDKALQDCAAAPIRGPPRFCQRFWIHHGYLSYFRVL